ncbi:hypothetical protein AGMMS4952_26490 [Spirochaetia bacterium]|nr:hypothetical protein AGMMS4952_26490 [Spirochaetia bacterium]
MKDLTDEEYDALDELLTRTTPELSGKPGYYTTHIMPLIQERMACEAAEADEMVTLDRLTIQWLRTRAETTHKTPAEIIGELVRKELASAS